VFDVDIYRNASTSTNLPIFEKEGLADELNHYLDISHKHHT
jgi:hypothetical protein